MMSWCHSWRRKKIKYAKKISSWRPRKQIFLPTNYDCFMSRICSYTQNLCPIYRGLDLWICFLNKLFATAILCRSSSVPRCFHLMRNGSSLMHSTIASPLSPPLVAISLFKDHLTCFWNINYLAFQRSPITCFSKIIFFAFQPLL